MWHDTQCFIWWNFFQLNYNAWNWRLIQVLKHPKTFPSIEKTNSLLSIKHLTFDWFSHLIIIVHSYHCVYFVYTYIHFRWVYSKQFDKINSNGWMNIIKRWTQTRLHCYQSYRNVLSFHKKFTHSMAFDITRNKYR